MYKWSRKENCRRSKPDKRGALLAASWHFHHFNNQIFSMKNPLKNPNNPLSKENNEMTCKSFYIFYKEIAGINKITNHVKSKRLKNFSRVILLFWKILQIFMLHFALQFITLDTHRKLSFPLFLMISTWHYWHVNQK